MTGEVTQGIINEYCLQILIQVSGFCELSTLKFSIFKMEDILDMFIQGMDVLAEISNAAVVAYVIETGVVDGSGTVVADGKI